MATKPVARKGGRSRPSAASRKAAQAARDAKDSRRLMKARILNLEGRISVLETFLIDARRE